MIWISVSILITYLLCLIPLSDKKPSFDVYEVCTELKHALSTSEISIESSLNQNNYSPKQKRIHINGDFLNSLHLTAVVLHEFGHYLTIKREHSLLDKIAKAMFFIAFILMLYFVYSIVNTFFYNIINISIIHYISIVFSSFASIYYTFTTYLELRANITALKLNPLWLICLICYFLLA